MELRLEVAKLLNLACFLSITSLLLTQICMCVYPYVCVSLLCELLKLFTLPESYEYSILKKGINKIEPISIPKVKQKQRQSG